MKIIIFGNRDFASLAKFYIGVDDIACFTVDGNYCTENEFEGFPLVPFEEIHSAYPASDHVLFCPIADNFLRYKKYLEGKSKGYQFFKFVHNSSIRSSQIGENSFILENNIIQPFVKFGKNIVMWTANHIGHHSIIEDNVFISSHVVVSGHCLIKKFAWLGVNSAIRDNVTVEENCIIGMGSAVTKNTEYGKTYCGVPAKIK